jgi:hypothetical protein
VEFELNIREIPCPYYGDVTQIALRKSIERNSCKVSPNVYLFKRGISDNKVYPYI